MYLVIQIRVYVKEKGFGHVTAYRDLGIFTKISTMLGCTMVQNNQELGHKYWPTLTSLIHLLALVTSFTCSVLLVSLVRSAHLFTHSLSQCQAGEKVID